MHRCEDFVNTTSTAQLLSNQGGVNNLPGFPYLRENLVADWDLLRDLDRPPYRYVTSPLD